MICVLTRILHRTANTLDESKPVSDCHTRTGDAHILLMVCLCQNLRDSYNPHGLRCAPVGTVHHLQQQHCPSPFPSLPHVNVVGVFTKIQISQLEFAVPMPGPGFEA